MDDVSAGGLFVAALFLWGVWEWFGSGAKRKPPRGPSGH